MKKKKKKKIVKMKTKVPLLWSLQSSPVGEKDNKLVNKTDDRIAEYGQQSPGNEKDVVEDQFRCGSHRKPLGEMTLKRRFEG